MSRLARIFMLTMLLVGVVPVVSAQEPLPTAVNLPTATITITPQNITDVGTNPEALPTGTPVPPLGVEQTEALPILISARADLELLATTAIGSAQRPLGWSGTIDVTDSQLPLWIRLDLETLAGAVLGAENRPAGWFGVVASIPLAVARDIRHDLELLADIVIGAPGLRPAGWVGDDPIMRCGRSIQSLLTVLKARGIGIPVDFTQPNYCDTAEINASRYVERQILQPPVVNGVVSQSSYSNITDNPFVVAFLDRKAQRKIGILPQGMGFQPISRSYVDFSNMMLVSGDDFQVFVDYTTTSLTQQEFLALPNVGSGDGEGSTYCNAFWCGVGLD